MKKLVALLACALVATHVAADDECDTETTYSIECWIVGEDANGKELVITAPKISVFENQDASIRDVCQIPRPGNTDDVEWLEEGTAMGRAPHLLVADSGTRNGAIFAGGLRWQTRVLG